jgi:hypothetical protein
MAGGATIVFGGRLGQMAHGILPGMEDAQNENERWLDFIIDDMGLMAERARARINFGPRPGDFRIIPKTYEQGFQTTVVGDRLVRTKL